MQPTEELIDELDRGAGRNGPADVAGGQVASAASALRCSCAGSWPTASAASFPRPTNIAFRKSSAKRLALVRRREQRSEQRRSHGRRYRRAGRLADSSTWWSGRFSTNFYGIRASHAGCGLCRAIGTGRRSAVGQRLGPAFPLESADVVRDRDRHAPLRVADGRQTFTCRTLLAERRCPRPERFARRRRERILNRDVFVPTVEDVIVTKLRWSHCRPPAQGHRGRGERHCRPGRPDRLGLRDLLVRPARDAGSCRESVRSVPSGGC